MNNDDFLLNIEMFDDSELKATIPPSLEVSGLDGDIDRIDSQANRSLAGKGTVRQLIQDDIIRDVVGIESQEVIKTVPVTDELTKQIVGEDLPVTENISTDTTAPQPKRKKKIQQLVDEFVAQLQECECKVQKKAVARLQTSLEKFVETQVRRVAA